MDGRRRPVVLDAPSNLGLRPPVPGAVPGCYKLAGAPRDRGLVARIGAEDGGCLTPPRYDRTGWRPGDGVFHAAALASYARRLADRVRAVHGQGGLPVVLGGDCGILLGPALALRRAGRYGLAYLGGHSDVCIFDPDLDPDGRLPTELTDTLVAALTWEDGR